MKTTTHAIAALSLLTLTHIGAADASTFSFDFSGPGVSGSLTLTYGPATDDYYPEAFEVTGISGTFTNTNNGLGLVDVPVGALLPITNAPPHAGNLLAPYNLSRYAVAGYVYDTLNYDNLFWPGGSPQTASDYDLFGGFLDIYGLMFEIDGGSKVVNLWSNGLYDGYVHYGVAVADHDAMYDYQYDSIRVQVPEPGPTLLLGAPLLGLLARRRSTVRGARRQSAAA